MNKYEWIKQLSIDDMSSFLDDVNLHPSCNVCAFRQNIGKCRVGCTKGIKKWLLQECE